MKKYISFFGFLLLCGSPGFAQTIVTVVHQITGETLPGAHIIFENVEGKKHVVITDVRGQAKITVSGRKSAEVSYLGFEKKSAELYPNQQIQVALIPDEQTLSEFVVTGQYKPKSPEQAVQKVRVINKAKINNMAAVSLDEVLANELNININRDGILGSSMSMQGVSGQNVKIMIDGVPVIGRLNGDIDLSQILLQDVERIEIIEGPACVNYGTNALAGTINIITAKGANTPSNINAGFYGESIGTHNYSLAGTKSFAKHWQVSFSGARNVFNGWSSGDAFEPNTYSPVADASRVQEWNPKTQWFGNTQLAYNKNNTRVGYKFGYFDETIINRGAPRAPYGEIAFDDYYHTTRIDNAFSFDSQLTGRLRLNSVAALNYFQRSKETVTKDLVTLDEELVSDLSLLDTTCFSTIMNRSNFFIDFNGDWLSMEFGYDLNLEEAIGKRIRTGSQTQGDYALFTTAELRLKQVVIKPGLRVTHNTRYAAPVSPSINLKYDYDSWGFRASYAQGFRAPALKELYFDFVDINHNIIGNENLRAEHSDNVTFGATFQRLKNQNVFRLEAGGYYNQFKDLIELAVVDPVKQQYAYVNIGATTTTGIQMSASWVWKQLKAQAGFNYLGVANQFEGQEKQSFLFAPEVTANTSYTWHKTNTTVSVFYKYQGDRPITFQTAEDNLETRYLPGFGMMDLTLGQKFWQSRIHVSIGVKNVLDIQQIPGFSSAGGVHGGGGDIPISTGRLLFIKLALQWKEK